MGTIRNLQKLKRLHGSWAEVAKKLGITYRYLLLIRQGRKPGRFLSLIINQQSKANVDQVNFLRGE